MADTDTQHYVSVDIAVTCIGKGSAVSEQTKGPDGDGLTAAMWDWRNRFLGSDDVGDDDFGKLIERAQTLEAETKRLQEAGDHPGNGDPHVPARWRWRLRQTALVYQSRNGA